MTTFPGAAGALGDLGIADLISFARLFLANPDLPRRFAEDLPVDEPDPLTFYSGGPEGYVDYPTWEELQAGREAPAGTGEAT